MSFGLRIIHALHTYTRARARARITHKIDFYLLYNNVYTSNNILEAFLPLTNHAFPDDHA